MSKREALALVLDQSGCNALLRRAGVWQGLLVLNYHRIGHPGSSPFDHELWSASESEFERQVRWLAKNFDLIGVDDLDTALADRDRRFVMITFDDGYRDNYDVAFPILQRSGATATFFIATGFIDQPRLAWWDEIAWMVRSSSADRIESNPWTKSDVSLDAAARDAAVARLLKCYKSLDGNETGEFLDFIADATRSGRGSDHLADDMWMTWDMIRDLHANGMSIGAHTVSHPVLSRLRADEQEREIGQSQCRLEVQLNDAVTAFSYPCGSRDAFDRQTADILKRRRFRWAFSHYGSYCRRASVDPLDIPRFPVESYIGMPEFRSLASLPQLFV